MELSLLMLVEGSGSKQEKEVRIIGYLLFFLSFSSIREKDP